MSLIDTLAPVLLVIGLLVVLSIAVGFWVFMYLRPRLQLLRNQNRATQEVLEYNRKAHELTDELIVNHGVLTDMDKAYQLHDLDPDRPRRKRR